MPLLLLASAVILISKFAEAVTETTKTGDVEKFGKIEMVYIKGGTFIMGSPESEKDRENDEKQHKVTVSSFWMGKCEVTQIQYKEVMGTSPGNFEGENLPVEEVGWYDAVEYCNKLSEKHGLNSYYKIDKENKDPNNANRFDHVQWNVTISGGNGFRLPTEAEWEFACRAGSTVEYYWGNDLNDNYCWYDGNSDGNTHPVGKKKPNACGLYDMSGNVCEWCWDWYDKDYYGKSPAKDPLGADCGEDRVLRGGSWYFSGNNLRSAKRDRSWACFDESSYFGFRVVRSAN